MDRAFLIVFATALVAMCLGLAVLLAFRLTGVL